MTITHNLIFDTHEAAEAFKNEAYRRFAHLMGSPAMRLTVIGKVLVCGEMTYIKLDSHGLLDDNR